MLLIFKSAVAFFFLFFLHGTSIGNGQQGISYNVWCYEQVCLAEMFKFSTNVIGKLAYSTCYSQYDLISTKL